MLKPYQTQLDIILSPNDNESLEFLAILQPIAPGGAWLESPPDWANSASFS